MLQPGKPTRDMFPDDASFNAAKRAWRATLAGNVRAGNDPTIPRGGQAITSGGSLQTPATNMSKPAPNQGGAFAPNTDTMTPRTPTTPAKPAASAGVTTGDHPATASGRPWWESGSDDSTPDGGAGWKGSGDLTKDHPDWMGEIQNFGREHQHALANAYAAGDEGAFQQIRDRARKDQYETYAKGYGWADEAANPVKSYSDAAIPDAWKGEIGGWDAKDQNDWLRAFEAGDTASAEAVRDDARKKRKA